MDWKSVVAVEPVVDEADVDAELEAYVADSPALSPREPWRITSLGAADWAMRRLAEIQEVVQQYDDEMVRWRTARNKAASACEWFEARLKEWALAERARNDSARTLNVPHGTVSTRKSGERIEVVDEPLALAWAKQACPDAVKVEYSFLVSKVGACARVADVVREWRATHKSTGETEHQPVTALVEFTDEGLAAVQERLGDEYVVEARVERMVVDAAGVLVPGLGVRAEHTTATVRAYAQ